MVYKNLAGRCGHYCGACTIYRAYKDGGELFDILKKHYSQGDIYCEGCQALTKNSWGYNCKIVNCLDLKGVDFCYECEEFGNGGCEKWYKIAEDHAEIGMNLHENLLFIKTFGVEKWLEEQDKKWRCPSCGKPVSEEDKCFQCGFELR